MVRASPKVIEEVKKNLVLVDGLSREDQVRMPVLPANEFDADEHIVLSPMQLHWQYPAYDGKNSSKVRKISVEMYLKYHHCVISLFDEKNRRDSSPIRFLLHYSTLILFRHPLLQYTRFKVISI